MQIGRNWLVKVTRIGSLLPWRPTGGLQAYQSWLALFFDCVAAGEGQQDSIPHVNRITHTPSPHDRWQPNETSKKWKKKITQKREANANETPLRFNSENGKERKEMPSMGVSAKAPLPSQISRLPHFLKIHKTLQNRLKCQKLVWNRISTSRSI